VNEGDLHRFVGRPIAIVAAARCPNHGEHDQEHGEGPPSSVFFQDFLSSCDLT
jgi:hypothetical protein